MDQAISVMGEQGLAKLIEFGPVRASDVILPPGSAFVIANSLTVSKKAETAAGRYNLRVLECRLAAVLLAVALGTPSEEAAASVQVLKDVEAALGAAGKRVGDLLHDAPYSLVEVEGLLGASIEAVAGADFLPSVRAAAEFGGFKLRQRAEHVYSEAQRVLRFRDLCNSSASSSAASGETLAALGKMMDESHASCSVQYECSSPELEELTGLARELGALGARLTGAGWGGCMVALVKEGDVGPYIQALKDRFFQKRVASGELDASDLDSVVFATGPCPGASWGRMTTAGALES
jgi:N-acetylgalactosamine kinase